MMPVLTGLGVAFPPRVAQSRLWREFFAAHYRDVRSAGRIFERAGVDHRHAAVNPLTEDISRTGTGARMDRYVAEALPLGRTAVAAALAEARLPAAEVGLLAVVSCTGYSTPGIDILLARDLGLPADMQRLLVGHMGCYAALPGLAAVTDFVASRQRPAVLLCVEITSLHLQPPPGPRDPGPRDASQVVAHALFSDAASAVVLRPSSAELSGRLRDPSSAELSGRLRDPSSAELSGRLRDPSSAELSGGYEVLEVAAATDPATADQMTWDVTDHGFRMGLSARVPDSLAAQLPGLVDDLLGRHGLVCSDVAGWAVHPGGPRILDVVEQQLKLPAAALAPSRETLRNHGNCSSATVLVVLREVVAAGVPSGGYLVALAFGPGLTLYGVLLRAL